MDVHLLFNSFNKMLSVSYETILPAQILFLEHIYSTYPHFLKELSSLDLAKLVTLMMDSVTKDAKLMNAKLKGTTLTTFLSAVNGLNFLKLLNYQKVSRQLNSALNQNKPNFSLSYARNCITTIFLIIYLILALSHVVNSQIFQDNESRGLLLPTCCEHIKMHLLGREEMRLCSDILGDIIEFLSLRKADLDSQSIMHRDINVLVEIIMQPLTHTLINMEKDILSTVVVCVIISHNSAGVIINLHFLGRAGESIIGSVPIDG